MHRLATNLASSLPSFVGVLGFRTGAGIRTHHYPCYTSHQALTVPIIMHVSTYNWFFWFSYYSYLFLLWHAPSSSCHSSFIFHTFSPFVFPFSSLLLTLHLLAPVTPSLSRTQNLPGTHCSSHPFFNFFIQSISCASVFTMCYWCDSTSHVEKGSWPS